MNKNIAFIIAFVFSIPVFSQVAIGKPSVANGKISLEFGISDPTNGHKGLLLPWVSTVVGTPNASYTGVLSPVEGTMIYDVSDHKVKVKYVAGWKDLSVDTSGTTVDPLTSVDGMVIQNAFAEDPSARVSIGTGVPSQVSGILVLEDADKAMVLPKAASPHLNIVNPAPGLMVYDTVKKQLAVFNGKVWTFWKP